VIRAGAERAEISAAFDLLRAPRELKRWLDEQSISAEAELTVRRVIAADGRSRAYLNGQVAPVQLLKDLGAILIDIHGQHEFQSLTRGSAQRELLDDFGRLDGLAGQVEIAHRVWNGLLNRMLDLEGKARDREARLDLLRYQVRELEALQAALQHLYESEDGSAHAAVSRALQALRAIAAVDTKLHNVLPLVDEAAIQIREAAHQLQHYLEGLDVDTARQDHVERRLAAIEELARKHRITPAELPQRAGQLKVELDDVERADSNLATLRKEQAAALDEYRTLAGQLSARRSTAGRTLSKDITARMQTLGMAGGRFSVEISPLATTEPAPHGVDQIEFRVTANPGQPLRPLAKVASGGELSRLSLAVQVASAARETRVMVFDEVDSGIGGAVAEIVGRELRALAEERQVLCVTHLPQVASQAHHHLRVVKLTDGKTTRTSLHELNPEERVEELARMLGGIEITAKAREHAREMLKANLEKAAEAKEAVPRAKTSKRRS
jgi:DNA repair protein RecN (Recombination protein N)